MSSNQTNVSKPGSVVKPLGIGLLAFAAVGFGLYFSGFNLGYAFNIGRPLAKVTIKNTKVNTNGMNSIEVGELSKGSTTISFNKNLLSKGYPYSLHAHQQDVDFLFQTPEVGFNKLKESLQQFIDNSRPSNMSWANTVSTSNDGSSISISLLYNTSDSNEITVVIYDDKSKILVKLNRQEAKELLKLLES